MVTYYALATALIGLLISAIYSRRRTVRLSDRAWDDIIARIQRIDGQGLATVAVDYLNPPQHQTAIQPRELWKLVGAYDGFRRMRANADLMLLLAAHAADWNFEEATIVG
jgi:hypothetical protein